MNIYKILQSRTILTIAVLFAFNGLSGIEGFMSPDTFALGNILLSLVAGYFRVNLKTDIEK